MLTRFRAILALGLLAAALLTFWPAQAVHAGGKPGDAGFLSLRFPVGARETGMGGAGVASATGASAVYWNPALLAFADSGTDVLLQHQRLYDLFDKETAAVAHRTRIGALGFFFSGFYADEIDRYGSEPVGVPEGTFSPHQVAFGVSYARAVASDLTAGLSVKLLHEKIDVFDATGFALDLAVAHRTRIRGLTLGAALSNIGSGLTLNEESYDLPLALRVGAAYDPPQAFFAGNVSFAADVIVPNDGNEKAHLGVEYRLLDALALRVGAKINYEVQGNTAGVGFRRGPVDIGYAYEHMKEGGFESWHRFAVGLSY